MSFSHLRPRSSAELLDATFALLRHNYVPLATVCALLQLPMIVHGVVAAGAVYTQLMVTLVTGFVTQAAAAWMVSETLLGRAADPAQALRRVAARAHRVLLAGFALTLLMMVGAFLLIVPGALAWGALFAAPTVVVIEDVGAMVALHRSSHLTEDRVWRCFALLATVLVVTTAMAMAVGWVAGLFLGWTLGQGPAMQTASTMIGGVLGALVLPVQATFATLLYYDLRVRRDGLDLELMAEQLPAAAPAAAV